MYDLSGLTNEILALMEKKLPSDLTYHSIAHTRDEVLPAARLLAQADGFDAEQADLLEVAAILHDTGYIRQWLDNESIAADYARDLMPKHNFSPMQINIVARAIMTTAMPQTPGSCLEKSLCDADLVSLGAHDFYERSMALRNELINHGRRISLQSWHDQQIEFLQTHRYFTNSAKTLWNSGKMQALEKLLKARARDTKGSRNGR